MKSNKEKKDISAIYVVAILAIVFFINIMLNGLMAGLGASSLPLLIASPALFFSKKRPQLNFLIIFVLIFAMGTYGIYGHR